MLVVKIILFLTFMFGVLTLTGALIEKFREKK